MEFRKTVMTSYMQGSKRDTDVKNRLLDYWEKARWDDLRE